MQGRLLDGNEDAPGQGGSDDCSERYDGEGDNEIEPAYLTDDEEPANHEKRQEYRAARGPPGCGLSEDERRKRHAEGCRVEQVLLADSEDVFRRHRPGRSEYQESDARAVRRADGTYDECQDEPGDVGRLDICRNAETSCK